MKLPVYSRANLSRTVVIVVALFSTTSAVAPEFRDIYSRIWGDLKDEVQQFE